MWIKNGGGRLSLVERQTIHMMRVQRKSFAEIGRQIDPLLILNAIDRWGNVELFVLERC